MFKLSAITGWVLVIASALVVAAMTVLGMYIQIGIHFAGQSIVDNMANPTAQTPEIIASAQAKITSLKELSENSIIKFFNTDIYGVTKVTNLFFGGNNFFVINGEVSIIPNLNIFQLWIWPIIVICSQLFLVFIAAVELHELRKSQMISKPFVKIIIISTMALDLILGKMVSVIGGGLLFAGLVMLEVVLMSSTAVQNFAEKTNLTAIHGDEKKFEKESRKSGKAMEYDPIIGMNPNGSINPEAEIKYSEIPDQVTDPSAINNKKYRKYYIQWSALKDQLDKFRTECYEKAQDGSLGERARFKLQSKFNERAEKINVIAKELKLVDSFKESYIDLSNITPADVAAAQQFINPTMIKSGGALEQATTAFASKGESSTDYDPNIENIYNTNSTAQDGFKAPSFDGVSEAPIPGGRPETFVVPTTVATEGLKARAEKQKQFLQAALARAIRMDWGMLPETSQPANFTVEQLTNDLGIRVETKDASYGSGNTKIISAPTPSPEFSNDQPSFDTKVTEPPKFGGFEEEAQEVPSFSTPGFGAEGRPETFVVPTTVATDGLNARRDRDKQFLQAALARAVRMDWGMLPASNSPTANNSIHEMESDLGLHVETKDASYSTKQINSMLAAETTIMEAPQSAPMAAPKAAPAAEEVHVSAPTFGGMPSISNEAPHAAPASMPSFAEAPQAPVQQMSQQVVTEMRQSAPNNSNPAEGVKIDQIERRMENIEKMIQSLSLAQNYQAPNSNIDSEKVNKLKDEFSKIEEQLSRISQTFDVTGTEPKNLFGALIRGYKYNNKK